MMTIQRQTTPNEQELRELFSQSFELLADSDNSNFNESSGQNLDDWFSLSEFLKYLPYGVLLEARDEGDLIGATFIGKQNPMAWPDGQKAELFILAVLPTHRQQGIGGKLLIEAEAVAREFGAKEIVVNTNQSMKYVCAYYLRQGYEEMGVLKNYYDNGNAVFFSKKIQ